MTRIIRPLEYTRQIWPAVFLAGPILGVDDWQSYAIDYMKNLSNVICPRRLDFTCFDLEEQVNWEQFYLTQILEDRKKGVVMFWCPIEQYHDCKNPYAKQTRFEFGEAVFGIKYLGSKVVVGIENGFAGEKEFRIIFKKYDVNIQSTLEDTCDEALRII